MRYSEFKDIPGIYLITRLSTGQMYVGLSTISIYQRWKDHKNGTSINHSKLEYDMVKHGEKDFVLDILEDLSHIDDIKLRKQEAIELEIYYISKLNTFENNYHYNLTPGGEANWIGKNHPSFKDYPTIQHAGEQSGKNYYYLVYYGKRMLGSYNKEILQKYIDNGLWIKFYEGTDEDFIKNEKEKLKYVGVNHWNYKGYPRIVRGGIDYNTGKTRWRLCFGKNNVISSVNLNKLIELKDSGEYLNYERVAKYDFDLMKIYDLYTSGLTTSEISELLGCSRRTIDRRIRKLFTKDEINKLRVQKISKTHKNNNSLDNQIKASKLRTSTGYFRVSKIVKNNLVRYQYTYKVNNKRKTLKSPSIKDLEKRVRNNNLPWVVVDIDKARNTLKESN